MYFVRRRLQAADLFSGVGVGRSAFPHREKCHGAPAARLGTKGTLSSVAFFVKEQKQGKAAICGKGDADGLP